MSAPAPRDYASAPQHVSALYEENHRRQTLAFVRAQKARFGTLDRARLSAWEALERLDQLADQSDPDTELSQLQHALQTAESIRLAGLPEWLVLTGLVHDLGKMLCLFGEPQWAVVGDTFPVGCSFSNAVVFPEAFASNPDAREPAYGSPTGIYTPGIGLEQVHMSFGHDEYLHRVLRDRLPQEALYVIRYHSFYAQHQHGAYDHLLDEHDRELMQWVRLFQPHDLYSKADAAADAESLRPRYQELLEDHLPGQLEW